MPQSQTKPRERTAFALWLTTTRAQRGRTQTTLAEAAGVSGAAVSKIEAGGKFSPGMVSRLVYAMAGGSDAPGAKSMLASALRAAFGMEAEQEPFLDRIREAGVIEDLPEEAQEEILDFIRVKVEQARQMHEKG